MRLAIIGLISLVALHTVCRAQLQDLLLQEIQQIAASSSWTVPFSNYITSDELPPGQSLEVATVSERLCGAGFVNSSGQVNVALLQDISEFTFVNVTTFYYVDVLKATEAQAASTVRFPVFAKWHLSVVFPNQHICHDDVQMSLLQAVLPPALLISLRMTV